MDVLEELTDFEPKIDRAYVERRVRDWDRRVRSLYNDVRSWLPPDWMATENSFVLMDEKLMRKFGVQSQNLPSLLLSHAEIGDVTIEPRGLWIIGANGRIDVTSASSHSIITDRSGIFDPPEWVIAPLTDRMARLPFDRDALLNVLA